MIRFGIKLIFPLFLFTLACNTERDNRSINVTATEFNKWSDSTYNILRHRSPILLTRHGIKDRNGEWDDLSNAEKDTILALKKGFLIQLKSFDTDKFDKQAKLTHRLMQKDFEFSIQEDRFRHYNYPAHQMRGIHDFIPSFLINFHSIESQSDAETYLSRLTKSEIFLNQAIENIKKNESEGILTPYFVFEHIIRSSKNIIKGAPFDTTGNDSPIFADFIQKINNLPIQQVDKDSFIQRGRIALITKLLPAYQKMISLFEQQKQRATKDHGVWKFKNGDDFYASQLKKMTTTNMTADEIFEIGMKEVNRIHNEMNLIKEKVGFEGSLQEFFAFMRDDSQFYYPNDDTGRKSYIEEATKIIDKMKGELDGLFLTKPKADFIIKAVEPFREKAAGKAFYQSPSLDGSRPGTYYANLYDMTQMPTYQMEALAYHEAIPGHHMQIAIKQELEGLPLYRTLGAAYTAYSEGWGLYSELIPKELGFYEDPYSDFGRLAMELWRSCRLVVDTGIHHKKWTRQEGIEFYKTNTPNPEQDCIKMVERHIVMPGQATAYKVGQLKLLELREKAKKSLGKEFDIREFHDVVLTNGAVPLDVLEELVNEYITEKQ